MPERPSWVFNLHDESAGIPRMSPPASEGPLFTGTTGDPGPGQSSVMGAGSIGPSAHSVSCQPEMTASVTLQAMQKTSMRSSLRFITHISPRQGLRRGRCLQGMSVSRPSSC
jgi:hypothetical protein